jgi:hypothetical protein
MWLRGRRGRTEESLGEEESRSERGAQLVRERGEEVILGLVGVLSVLVETDVVDGQRRPSRQLLARRLVLILRYSTTDTSQPLQREEREREQVQGRTR